jgi:hypothetical protein
LCFLTQNIPPDPFWLSPFVFDERFFGNYQCAVDM